MATGATENARELLLSSIKGQFITIPDLRPIFENWKGINSRHINPLLDPLRKKVNKRLENLGFDECKRQRLEAADFALFTALWWPDISSLGHLEIMAYLVIWLFTWDDEIDEPGGTFTDDIRGATKYREHTLNFVGVCLGLHPPSETVFRPTNHIVQSFDIIGAAFAAKNDVFQRQRLFDEIARFMEASEVEQTCRLEGRVFSLGEYWPIRMGTSAVYISAAAAEYSIGCSSALSLNTLQSQCMQALWDETNIIISVTNDLLSLSKEMRLGCIDSIIPLLFASTNDIPLIVRESLATLRASKKQFDIVSEKLLEDVASSGTNSTTRCQIENLIQTLRSNCVGNLIWSLETRRYNLANLLLDDGSLKFVL